MKIWLEKYELERNGIKVHENGITVCLDDDQIPDVLQLLKRLIRVLSRPAAWEKVTP